MSSFTSNLQSSTLQLLATLETSKVMVRYLGVVPTPLKKQKCCPLSPEASSLCTGDELFLISAQLVTPRSKMPSVAVVSSLSHTAGNWLILALICSCPRPVLVIPAVPKRQTSTECNTLQAHPSWKLNKIWDILAKIPTVNYSQRSQPSLVSPKG